MKRVLTQILVALFTFTCGVAVHVGSRGSGLDNCVLEFSPLEINQLEQVKNPASDDWESARVMWQGCPTREWLVEAEERYVTISVLNDGEFYVNKQRVSLADMPTKVEMKLGSDPSKVRVIFIKSSSAVHYATLNSLVQKLRETNADCIELVPNKGR
jgi:biopolymer transport protein ExbD